LQQSIINTNTFKSSLKHYLPDK